MRERLSRLLRVFTVALLSFVAASPALAQNGTWNVNASGNWTDSGNWASGTIADGADFTATFGDIIDADRTITLNGTRTIGNVTASDTSNNYTISGNTLTLDVTTGVPVIDVTTTGRTLTIGSVIAGNDGMQKNGLGTLRVTSIPTYTGTTTISAGTVEVTAGTAGGSAVWSTGNTTLNQGTTVFFNPTNQAIQNTSGFTVSGPITLGGGAGTATMRFAGNDNKFALSGGVTGEAGVAQTLSVIQGGPTLGAGDRQDILYSGAIADGSGGTLGVSVDFSNSSSTAQSAFVNLRGQNTFTGNLVVTNSRGMNGGSTYPGAWLTIGGERYVGFSAPTTATIGSGFLGAGANYSGAISVSNGSGGLTTLSFLTSANQTLQGVISGNGSLQQQGNGTLTLTAANTFSGNTTVVTGAGALVLNNNLALQNSALVTSGGGSVNLGAGVTTPTFGGLSGASGNLATVISSGYSSVTALTLNPNSGSVTYAGNIVNGAAGMMLTKTGNGTQILAGINTYTGGTTINAGTLQLSGNGTLGSASGRLTVNTGGTLNLNGVSVGSGNFTGTGGLVTSASAATLTIGNANATGGTYQGVIGGSVALTKVGTGSLTLSGNNTYAGGTTSAPERFRRTARRRSAPATLRLPREPSSFSMRTACRSPTTSP